MSGLQDTINALRRNAESLAAQDLTVWSDAMTDAAREIEILVDLNMRAAGRTVEWRKSFREKKKTAEKYGLALMMIAEGCEDPVGFARETLNKAKGVN